MQYKNKMQIIPQIQSNCHILQQNSHHHLKIQQFIFTRYQANPIVSQDILNVECVDDHLSHQTDKNRSPKLSPLPLSSKRKNQHQHFFQYAIRQNVPLNKTKQKNMQLTIDEQNTSKQNHKENELQSTQITTTNNPISKNKTNTLMNFHANNMKIFLSEQQDQSSISVSEQIYQQNSQINDRIQLNEPYNKDQVQQIEQISIRSSSNGLREIHHQLPSFTIQSLLQPRNLLSSSQIIQEKKQFIKNNRLKNIKLQIMNSLEENNTLKLIVERKNRPFNFIWPQYQLKFNDKEVLMAAKKTSHFPSSYIITLNNSEFQENSGLYLAKIKSNYKGDVINIFGPGLNPKKAIQSHEIPRQLLATIVHDQVGQYEPRKFKVYIKKPQFHYYLHFQQVKMYKQEIPLHQLYNFHQNIEKIQVYTNRQPVYHIPTRTYLLNFNGNAKCSSIKNFVLESINQEQTIICGKIDDSNCNLLISSPISPLIGFAVSLSNFDYSWLI